MFARKLLVMTLVGSILVLQPGRADPHPGGTNAEGCHTDHRTGDYHCHGQKSSMPTRETYCHVINGSRRCGYARTSCNNLVAEYGGYCVAE
jgi:hypothetical protein